MPGKVERPLPCLCLEPYGSRTWFRTLWRYSNFPTFKQIARSRNSHDGNVFVSRLCRFPRAFVRDSSIVCCGSLLFYDLWGAHPRPRKPPLLAWQKCSKNPRLNLRLASTCMQEIIDYLPIRLLCYHRNHTIYTCNVFGGPPAPPPPDPLLHFCRFLDSPIIIDVTTFLFE